MNTSTEHISQHNQSEPLADASGRIVDLVIDNALMLNPNKVYLILFQV